MTACAICGQGTVTGVYRDALDRPAHYVCVARLALTRDAVAAIKATATPPLPRRQSARRVRR